MPLFSLLERDAYCRRVYSPPREYALSAKQQHAMPIYDIESGHDAPSPPRRRLPLAVVGQEIGVGRSGRRRKGRVAGAGTRAKSAGS